MSKAAFDLVIVGVGGQGTLLASKILGRLALSENCGVKVSEVHGMSQRGVPRALPRRERRRAGHRRGVRQPEGAEPGAARHVQPASAL